MREERWRKGGRGREGERGTGMREHEDGEGGCPHGSQMRRGGCKQTTNSNRKQINNKKVKHRQTADGVFSCGVIRPGWKLQTSGKRG